MAKQDAATYNALRSSQNEMSSSGAVHGCSTSLATAKTLHAARHMWETFRWLRKTCGRENERSSLTVLPLGQTPFPCLRRLRPWWHLSPGAVSCPPCSAPLVVCEPVLVRDPWKQIRWERVRTQEISGGTRNVGASENLCRAVRGASDRWHGFATGGLPTACARTRTLVCVSVRHEASVSWRLLWEEFKLSITTSDD